MFWSWVSVLSFLSTLQQSRNLFVELFFTFFSKLFNVGGNIGSMSGRKERWQQKERLIPLPFIRINFISSTLFRCSVSSYSLEENKMFWWQIWDQGIPLYLEQTCELERLHLWLWFEGLQSSTVLRDGTEDERLQKAVRSQVCCWTRYNIQGGRHGSGAKLNVEGLLERKRHPKAAKQYIWSPCNLS